MSTTLVQRARQIVAAENDDFFRAETILYYLNKSQRRVVSRMVQQELRGAIQTEQGIVPGNKRSLRALDSLRKQQTTNPSGFTAKNGYFVGTEDFPSDLNQVLFLRYNGTTVLRELNSQNLYLLEWGNLSPTQYEGYFYITDSDGRVFELYLHENPDGSSDELLVFYVSDPTPLTLESETLPDLPEQLENAVIYGAGVMMGIQETFDGTQSLMELYREELQAATF